jgi:hypothetical protein
MILPSAQGASFIISLGQRPRDWDKIRLRALKARFKTRVNRCGINDDPVR